ncbi:MAG TPA: PAS domain S-box protein, partial [Candidatus Eisenbacteria bacterium]|nr:PAS domain S-box protein [Candidatus Eisenbacteria bacterium]
MEKVDPKVDMRRFGLDFVGGIPWGTHLCQFYQTKRDLTDILLPYFAEGLKSNEFCMWVTSPPLEVDEAKKALMKKVPDLDRYIEKGQIEIISYMDWYLLGGVFDADRVLQGWVKKEEEALKNGFEGLRLTGNTFWIERKDWDSFTDYEASVNAVIGSHRMVALCTYSLKKCKGTDVVDVMRNHVGTLIRKGKAWNLVEDVAVRKKTEEEMNALSVFPAENPNPVIRASKDGKVLYANSASLPLLSDWHTEVGQAVGEEWRRQLKEVYDSAFKKELEVKVASRIFSFLLVPITSADYVNIYGRDVTDAKKAGESIRKQAELIDLSPVAIMVTKEDNTITFWSKGAEKLYGWTRTEAIGKKARLLMRTEFPEPLESILDKLRRTGQWNGELVHHTKEGKDIVVQSGWIGKLDGNGNIEEILESNENITERKLAEQALLESQKDLNRAQTVAKTGSWRLDVRRNVLLWSDETYRIFGVPLGTPMTYEAFLSTIHPDDRGYVDEKWKAALQGGDYDIEHRIIADGKSKWVREKAELEFDKNGVLLGGFGTVQDLTELKRTEEALRRAKDEWERTFDSIPDLIALLDNQHRIVRANRAMANKLGLTPEHCVGLNCFKIVHGTVCPPEFCPHTQTLKDAQEHVAEVREDQLGGDFLVTTTPLKDETGQMIGSIHVARDITERKKTEDQLRKTSDYLENLINFANAPIIVWDTDLRITRFNHAFERLTGLDSVDAIGKKLAILFPEDRKRQALDHIEHTLTGEYWETVEIPIQHKNGTVRTALWNSANIYANDGKTVIATIAQGQDITERKKAEGALRETRDYLDSLLNYANAPIIVWDPEFRITMFNRAFERLSGLSSSEAVGKRLDVLFPKEQKGEAMGYIQRTLAGEQWETVEIPILHKDGTVRTLLWNSANIYDPNSKRVVATIAQGQDITERKSLEAKLEQYARHLEQLVDEKTKQLQDSERLATIGQTAGMVGHDIRNP